MCTLKSEIILETAEYVSSSVLLYTVEKSGHGFFGG
jgi:hypothetical protein